VETRREDNIFGVLRLLAATLVLASHCWNLQKLFGPQVGGDTLGALGVGIFFAISGYLVTQSWAVDPRLGAFLTKRALRLLPGLWLAVLVAVLVVGRSSPRCRRMRMRAPDRRSGTSPTTPTSTSNTGCPGCSAAIPAARP
jgi:peptidoglycan/LPS O-acetylase OafA/YrhL